MTLLPVVHRELRVASRERNTYRVRFLAALIPVLFCIFSLWIITFLREPPIPGRNLFYILTWIAFIFVTVTGFCLTADSIAEEKRDATLGLLFLTDLKGYDVVLGKICGAGIRGLYALLATFPVLALPLMMGGSGAGEFARTVLVLFLTLLLSMSIGIFCSAIMRKTWSAAALSLLFMLVLQLGLPAAASVIRYAYQLPDTARALEICSPSYAFMMCFANVWGMPSGAFFLSISLLFGFSFTLLFSTSIITPFVWKDRPPKKRMAGFLDWRSRLLYGSQSFRKKFRTRLCDINPVFWLTGRDKFSSLGFLLLIGGLGLIVHFLNRQYLRWGFFGPRDELVFPFLTWIFFAGIVHALLILRIAVVAGEKFGEDRKSGALELLVSTPLQIKEVLRGQWLSLGRQFAGPISAAFFIHIWPILWLSVLVAVIDYPPRPLNFTIMVREVWNHIFSPSYVLRDNWPEHLALLIMLGLVPLLILDWIAVAWTSMWLSLRVKRAITAPIAAVFLVHLPPWFFWAVTMTWLDYKKWIPQEEFSQMLVGYLLIATFIVANQVLWSAFSRRQLLKNFRTAATDRYQPPRKMRWWQIRIA